MLFQSPIPIDRSHIVSMKRPEAWQKDVSAKTVDVLPLVENRSGDHRPGWTSYCATIEESPQVEIFCGGINTKAVDAAGIWRDGNLLHFGFDLSPAEMNETGRALLSNSIAYIARFSKDRVFVRMPSPFATRVTRSRETLARWARNEDYPLTFVTDHLEPSELAGIDTTERATVIAWVDEQRAYLHPSGTEGRVCVDREAKSLELRFDDLAFFERGIELLNDVKATEVAGRVLSRYAPEGPGANAGAVAWRNWFAENRPYLFFTEYGGFRWYVDPLAKDKKIPTAECRGIRRMDDSRRKVASGN